jgi:ATP-dependent DNA helicase RecG
MITQRDEITVIKGIGPKKAEAFASLDIRTVGDLIAFLPRAYKDRGRIKAPADCIAGQKALIKAAYIKASGTAYYAGRSKVTLTFAHDGRPFKAVYFNQPYMRTNLTPGRTYLLYGTVMKDKDAFEIVNAQAERSEDAVYLKEGLYPVYGLPQGCGRQAKGGRARHSKGAFGCRDRRVHALLDPERTVAAGQKRRAAKATRAGMHRTGERSGRVF